MTSAERTRLRLAAQNGAVSALVGSDSPKEATRELLREVCENLNFTVGAFWCPASDPDRGSGREPDSLYLDELWADPLADVSPFVESSQEKTFHRGEGLPGRVWESGQPAWLTDVAVEPGYARAAVAERAGLHGAFAVPVPLDDERGVLEFHARQVLEPDPELLDTMCAVGGYLGQFVQKRRAEAALRASEERYRFQARLLDAVGEAVMATDTEGRILYWNAHAEQLYGWEAQEVLGRDVAEVTPTLAAREQARQILTELRKPKRWGGEFMVRDRWGREFPVLANLSPIVDNDGQPIGVIGTSFEISGQRRREEGQRFLAEAGRVLASSLDYATTLRSVANLAVPFLGDCCLVQVRDLSGQISNPVARVAGAEAEEALERLQERAASVVEAVLAGERALVWPAEPAPAPLGQTSLAELGIRSLLAVPLRARCADLGVIIFATIQERRSHDQTDVALAEELGRRAGLAIDNARLYKEASEGNRAKADFLAVVSHELRTPLNAIAGYADLLAGGIAGELTDTQQQHVERIKIGAGHLAHLIDEVLSYARMESGHDTVQLESSDLGTIAREAAVVIEPDATSKGLDLVVDMPEEGPVLLTDPAKVRQILVNLLSNAVKYTEQGEVHLTASPKDDGAVVQVRDTGVGIAAEARERIFEPFWQAESPNTRSVGGTGLGLSVTRRLARLLKGDVYVESEVGAGSTFTVALPDLA